LLQQASGTMGLSLRGYRGILVLRTPANLSDHAASHLSASEGPAARSVSIIQQVLLLPWRGTGDYRTVTNL
jgi:hypothetical protein